MKDFLREIFGDTILSIITKKYGTSLNDSQREAKAEDVIAELRDKNGFTIDMIQSIIDKKGLNSFEPSKLNGQSVYRLAKTGLFGKAKVCYYITRSKDKIDGIYLENVYAELNSQANGTNILNAPDYSNK